MSGKPGAFRWVVEDVNGEREVMKLDENGVSPYSCLGDGLGAFMGAIVQNHQVNLFVGDKLSAVVADNYLRLGQDKEWPTLPGELFLAWLAGILAGSGVFVASRDGELKISTGIGGEGAEGGKGGDLVFCARLPVATRQRLPIEIGTVTLPGVGFCTIGCGPASTAELVEENRRLHEELSAMTKRHRDYADGIAQAIGMGREKRASGEPARSDRVEIEMLREERDEARREMCVAVHFAEEELGDRKMSPQEIAVERWGVGAAADLFPDP